MIVRPVQVDAGSYQRCYMTLPRMVTHWHQANAIAEVTAQGGKVLEVGPGSGHTTWLLRQWGMDVTTLDFDASVRADLVGDICEMPCDDDSFDCVLAAEVLEHIPFVEFGTALSELRRVSRRHVVITLPAPLVGVSAVLNFPRLKPWSVSIGVPYFVNHNFDGQHYWELGKRGYGVRRVRRMIRDRGFRILKEFRPAPSLYCYFFILATA